MPASLLDSQLETLEPLGPDEAGFVVDAALPAQEAVQQVLDWLDVHGTPTGR
jgi:gluconokinase